MAEVAMHRPGGAAGVLGPVYVVLFPIPVVCFLAAVATDAMYAGSAFLLWLHFSEWLIAAGLAFGALAALALLVTFIASRAVRAKPGWLHFLLFYAALVVELFNALVHTIDGYTAVVWTGMALTVVGALLALAAAVSLLANPVAWVGHRGARA
jgi:uncharacterized membrane protein